MDGTYVVFLVEERVGRLPPRLGGVTLHHGPPTCTPKKNINTFVSQLVDYLAQVIGIWKKYISQFYCIFHLVCNVWVAMTLTTTQNIRECFFSCKSITFFIRVPPLNPFKFSVDTHHRYLNEKCNKTACDSFIHISLVLNSPPGSCGVYRIEHKMV